MWAIQPNSALPEAIAEIDSRRVELLPAGHSGSDAENQSEEEEVHHGRTPSSGAKRPHAALRYYEDSEVRNERAAGKDAGGKRANRNCCFLCGGWSHHASSCPNDRCIACLQTGHQSHTCPAGKRPRVCPTCGRVGHTQRECTLLEEISPEELAECRCVACGSLGHLDCTPFEQRPKRPFCFNCGAAGHEANACAQDGNDRWQRLFTQALSYGASRTPGSGGSYGSAFCGTPGSGGSYGGKGRASYGGTLSSQRGPPPSSSSSLDRLMSRTPGSSGGGGGGWGSGKGGKSSGGGKGSGGGKAGGSGGGSGGKGGGKGSGGKGGGKGNGNSHTRFD